MKKSSDIVTMGVGVRAITLDTHDCGHYFVVGHFVIFWQKLLTHCKSALVWQAAKIFQCQCERVSVSVHGQALMPTLPK